MTKKDYIIIAKAINQEVEGWRGLGSSVIAHKELLAIRYLVKTLCESMKADNPRFDDIKFVEACGFHRSEIWAIYK